MKPRLIQVVAPLIAGLFYGAWAAYSNWMDSMHTAIVAGTIQASFAFMSTLLLTSLVLHLLERHRSQPRIVFLQSSLALIGTPATLHLIAGTPNILTAMLPGLVIGHVYLWGLIKRLHNGREHLSL